MDLYDIPLRFTQRSWQGVDAPLPESARSGLLALEVRVSALDRVRARVSFRCSSAVMGRVGMVEPV